MNLLQTSQCGVVTYDGDGVSDADEIPHSPGSNPNDPDDNGDPANCVTFKLTIGDISTSFSERWEAHFIDDKTGEPVIRHGNQGYGTPKTDDYALVKGKSFTYWLKWTDTNGTGDDFDYQFLFNDADDEGLRQGLYATGPFIIEDPDKLLTDLTHGHNGNPTLGKKGKIIVPGIAIRKQGTQVVPESGLVVLASDTLEFAIAPYYFGKTTTMENEITWQYRQMQHDGSYASWQGFPSNVGKGTTFSTTMDGGIYQIRANIGGTMLEYTWQKDEDTNVGSRKKGQPDHIGVCDKQWQLNVRHEALSFLGSTMYATATAAPAQYGFSGIPADRNKCNIFVAHRCVAAGVPVPAINHGSTGLRNFPPSANQWANEPIPTAIAGWLLLNTSPSQPGYVAAHPVLPEGPGHCGIVDYDGMWISAGASGNVNRKWDGRASTSRYRRYQP